jgi:DNA-3-methyladenine glycosylase
VTPDLGDLLGGEVTAAARGLLGWRLRTHRPPGPTELVLTEVEAYSGAIDAAAHSYRGRTPRTEPMYGPAGGVYVYRSYGIHWCVNVVVGEPGRADAVLLRGGEPTEGADIMALRRKREDHLADGPGKLAQAMAITGADTGTMLGQGMRLLPPETQPGLVEVTTRIGISKAVDLPWRFILRSAVPAQPPGASSVTGSE